MPPPLYMHIGMPKAGSTAIQMDLAAAREELARHGLRYPGSADSHTDLIAPFHQLGPEHFFYRRSGLDRREALRRADLLLQETAAISPDSDVLLSCEYFAGLAPARLAAFEEWCRSIGRSLVVVCYVRHPFAAATSQAQQNVKMGDATLEDMRIKPVAHSLLRALRPALALLGRERLIVRDYEAARQAGTQRDILQAIGYRGPIESIAQTRANTGLSMAAVQLIDTANRLRADHPALPDLRPTLAGIAGPAFGLPRASLNTLRNQVEEELAWLDQNLGMTLAEPALPEPPPDMDPETARTLVRALAAQSRPRPAEPPVQGSLRLAGRLMRHLRLRR